MAMLSMSNVQLDGATTELRQGEWICAVLLFGLLIIEGWREGGFWSADAFVVAVASLVILGLSLTLDRPDRGD